MQFAVKYAMSTDSAGDMEKNKTMLAATQRICINISVDWMAQGGFL